MFSTAFTVKFPTTFVVFSTAFVVFVVVAGSSRAAPTDVSIDNAAIARILRSRSLSETKNYHLLTPELAYVSLDLYQGLISGTFQLGNSNHLHYFMVGVNLKIKEIAEDVASIASQVESTADVVDALHFADARFDYNVKRIYIKKLCEHTLATTNDILRLIDETKAMLGKGMSQDTLRIVHLTSISDLFKLAVFEAIREIMLEELDTERNDIAVIEGRIKSAKETVDVISFTLQNTSEQDLTKEAEALVNVVDQLKLEVSVITRKIYFLMLLSIIEE